MYFVKTKQENCAMTESMQTQEATVREKEFPAYSQQPRQESLVLPSTSLQQLVIKKYNWPWLASGSRRPYH